MFNLEKAIHHWKRKLRSNPAFEDGDIAELESHLRDEIEQLLAGGLPANKAFEKATGSIGDIGDISSELSKSHAPGSGHPGGWNPALFKSYIKVGRRNLGLNKLYAGINIFGLFIGITCCLLIYLYVQNAFSYDDFVQNGDRVYKLIRLNSNDEQVGITAAPYKDALELDYPGAIERATHIMPAEGVITIGDRNFLERRLFIADNNYFRIFNYPFLYGDPESALKQPNAIVLSAATARKYFGEDNPLGKAIEVDGEQQFQVTGVFKLPEGAHTHMPFDLAVSMATFKDQQFYTGWGWNQLHTYVKLNPGVEPGNLRAQFPNFVGKYFGEDLKRTGRKFGLDIIPLPKVYFANTLTYDIGAVHGNKTTIYIFAVIALLIIIVAVVNFVNLSTARSVYRAKEVGVRKTLGAQKSGLILQFISEAVLSTFSAGLLALIFIFVSLPFILGYLDITIATSVFSAGVLLPLAGFLFLTGLTAGLYPAFILSSFQPLKAIKQQTNFSTSQLITRKGLIIFQFVISSMLVIGVLIINHQLDYVTQQSPGFDSSQFLDIAINNSDISSNVETFKKELQRVPGVESVSAMSGTPGGFMDTFSYRAGEDWEKHYVFNSLFADEDYIETLQLKMISGRDFDAAFATDSSEAVVINQQAAQSMGWSPAEALGKRFLNQYRDDHPRRVIGVVENYNYQSLRNPIDPLVISMSPDRREVLLRINTATLRQTITNIEQLWDEFSPLYPIEYSFLDQQFEELYASEAMQRKIFFAFSLVAILIACLGLFGLTTFNAEKRSKEMGIRKILGASFSDLLLTFNKELFVTIGFAFLLAAPVTYFLAEQWLQDFAYRIPNSLVNYSLAGGIILLLGILTVSYQSIRLYTMNAIENLRSE